MGLWVQYTHIQSRPSARLLDAHENGQDFVHLAELMGVKRPTVMPTRSLDLGEGKKGELKHENVYFAEQE